jgi:hypothetical protein
LILKTTNFGNIWQIEDDGLTANNLHRIDFCHWADFWGGSFGPGIIVGEHKTVLIYPIVVSVEDQRVESKHFHLSQNYPNPFNPVTSIQYAISSRQFVTLKVYDLLGREVATLVNEEKPAGEYEVEFDGSKLSSGVYLYRLTAGEFNETRKLVLLK